MTNNDDEPDEPGTGFGSTFLEKLLLGVIDAHPAGDKTRKQRLDAAMKALVGHGSRGSLDQDEDALLFMAAERHRDQVNGAKIRSDKKLAETAIERFDLGADPKSKKALADRLREKFSGSYQKKSNKENAIDYRATYLYRALDHDYVKETLEQQELERLRDTFHIPMKLD